MKTINAFGLATALCLSVEAVVAGEFDQDLRFSARVDMGGTIPRDARITELDGPVSGQRMKFSPGFQMDMSLNYRLTDWLEVGPEFGMTLNYVDSIGNWSYSDTTLFQMPMMMNITLEYPRGGRFEPYIGVGLGGVFSFLTFDDGDYDHDYYYYDEPDGSGSDIAWVVQAYGGLRYRFNEKVSLGVAYRFLTTDRQTWDVHWHDGPDFTLGVDRIQLHTICLVLDVRF